MMMVMSICVFIASIVHCSVCFLIERRYCISDALVSFSYCLAPQTDLIICFFAIFFSRQTAIRVTHSLTHTYAVRAGTESGMRFCLGIIWSELKMDPLDDVHAMGAQKNCHFNGGAKMALHIYIYRDAFSYLNWQILFRAI